VQTYADGASVTLTAAPADSTYNGWGGDCSTVNPGSTCGLTMNADKTVSATFPP
jgi:Divergent InlB B-repeat domain